MKLYKFRSLANCKDLKHAIEILETGKFWCSRYWKLNDPMEGVYKYKAGTIPDKYIKKLYEEKEAYAICSFAGEVGFKNPLLWGYYANGFKGIAIEIDVKMSKSQIKKIKYEYMVPSINNENALNENNNGYNDDNIVSILTTKLCCWAHENEYRYLTKGSPGHKEIGTITAVYYGKPYITKDNDQKAQLRPRIRDYLCRIDSLNEIAKCKGIDRYEVRVIDGIVQKQQNNQDNETVD